VHCVDLLQDKIDDVRRELSRVNTLLSMEQPEEYRTSLIREHAALVTSWEKLTGEQNVKRHRSSFTVTVPTDSVQEVLLWKTLVMEKNVKRRIVSIDHILRNDLSRWLLFDLRWLQLKLLCLDPSNSNSVTLIDIKAMKKNRTDGERDLEVPYHAPLLTFFQAAAAGQNEIEFLKEDFTLAKPREDIRGMIRGQRLVPQECKSDCVYNPNFDHNSPKSIDANAEAFGKLLQCCLSILQNSPLHSPAPRSLLCSFCVRMEYVWFIKYSFNEGCELVDIEVSPHFPSAGSTITDNIICPIKDIVNDSVNQLAHLLPAAPTPGFKYLVRYVESLCSQHSIIPVPLVFTRVNNEVIDMSAAQILAHGHHSIVILVHPTSNYVMKISRHDLISKERSIHELVDHSSPYIRRMMPNGTGTITGAGNGLSFIMLEGVGQRFTSVHVNTSDSFSMLWDQAYAAVTAMHGCRVLHRDIKPDNMVLINGALLVNDFDISCSMDNDADLINVSVGTSAYHSPKLNSKWRPRDDLLSLALSFLSFRLPFPFSNPTSTLQSAINLNWVPAQMKNVIQNAYK